MAKRKNTRHLGPWFRVYVSLLDDPKLLRLTDAQFRAWVKIGAVAKINNGIVPGDITDLALRLRTPEGRVRDLLQAFINARLLERIGEHYVLHNWDERQFESDVSTERVKRFRERSGGVSATANVTAPEAETETELASSKEQCSTPREQVEQICEAMGISLQADPKRISWPDQLAKLLGAGLELQDLLTAARSVAGRNGGIKNLMYLKPIAEEASRVRLATKVAELFHETDAHGWELRFVKFYESGEWSPFWGGTAPGTDPRHPLTILERVKNRLKAA